jgi:hypothetical protein
MKYYDEDGLSFSYPDEWSLERQESDDGWAVTLQSPGTAFAQVVLDRRLLEREYMAQTALRALEDDYPSLEAEAGQDMMAGEMAIGHDIDFFSLDLTITAWTRCFYGMAGTVLVLCQVSGVDQEEYEPALRAICASMRSEE